MKRFTTLLLTLVMIFSLSITALAADTASASVLRLESIQGTVTVTNAAGRTLTASTNMRLLNGYTITTSASSYAYISLDDTKAVKLDALTTCTVRTQGSKLELLVESGNIFFNVTAPLSSSETLNIRTSTMVTGVRGTSGTVWSDGINQSGTRLHTGSATVTTINPTTGEASNDSLKTATVTAGQEAISSVNLTDGSTNLDVVDTNPADYSGFELDAISNETGLLDEILENDNTPLTQEVVSEAADRLSQEQQTQQVQQESATTAQQSQTSSDSTTTAPTTTTTTTPSSSGSSSSGSSSVTTTATVTSYSDLTTALANSNIVTITISDAITLEGNTTIDEGVNVIIADTGSLATGAYTLTVDGDITATDTALTIDDGGNLTFTGTITSESADVIAVPEGHDFIVTENDDDTYTLAAYYAYNSTIDGDETWADLLTALTSYDAVTLSTTVIMTDNYTLAAGKTLTIAEGGIIQQDLNQLTLSGTVELATDLTTTGTINFFSAGIINTNDYSLTIDWSFNSYGTINTSTPIIVTDAGTFNINTGSVISSGDTAITVEDGGTLIVNNITTQGTTVSAQSEDIITGDGALAFTYTKEDGTYTLASYVTYDNVIDGDETWADLVTALASYDTVTLSTDVAMTDHYELVAGKTLILTDDATISTEAYALTLNGTLTNNGTVTSTNEDFLILPDGYGYLTTYVSEVELYLLSAYYDYDATIDGDESWADVVTALTSYDAVTVSVDVIMTDAYTLASTKSITLDDATISTDKYALTVAGTVTATGTAISVDDGGSLTFTGTITSDSKDVIAVPDGHDFAIIENDDDTYTLESYISYDNVIDGDETWADLLTALTTYNAVTVSVDVTMTDAYTLASTKSITLDDATISTDKYALTVAGTVTATGTAISVDDGGSLTFTGTITSDTPNVIAVPDGHDFAIIENDDDTYTLESYISYDNVIDGDETWADLLTALTSYDAVTVSVDVTMTGAYELASGKTVNMGANTISTHDYDLTVAGTISGSAVVVAVGENDTLTVNGGSITTTGASAITVEENGTFTYTSGTVSAGSKAIVSGEGALAFGFNTSADGNTFTLTNYVTYDAYITGTENWDDVATAFTSYNTVTIATEMATLTTSYTIPTGKTLVIADGASVTASAPHTFTVFGTLDITGGTIANTGDDTYAVYVNEEGDYAGTVTMSGGTISATSTAVYIYDGTFSISGGLVESTASAAIHCNGIRTALTIDGSLDADPDTTATTIRSAYYKDPLSSVYGGYGFTTTLDDDDKYHYLTGYYTYDDSIGAEDTWADVVTALETYDEVTISGTTTNMTMTGNYTLLSGKTLFLNSATLTTFDSANSYTLTVAGTFNLYTTATLNTDTAIAVTDTGKLAVVGTLTAYTATAVTVEDGGTFTLDGDYATVTATSAAIITGDGAQSFTYSQDGSTFTLTQYGIDDSIDGNEGEDDLITALSAHDTVTVNNNLTLSTATNSYTGNIIIANGASLTVEDGTITGSVTNQEGGTFSMSGGTITSSGSTATVTNASKATSFIFSGGTIENTGTGYAFYNESDYTTTLSGDKINGSVRNEGTITMSGATITGTMLNNYVFTLDSGTIDGAVTNNSNFYMNGGTINGTMSTSSSFSMYGGTITNNGTFTMSGGTLTSSATATFVNSGGENVSFTMSAGTIENTADYVENGLYFAINDGSVTGLTFTANSSSSATGNLVVRSLNTAVISTSDATSSYGYDTKGLTDSYYYASILVSATAT